VPLGFFIRARLAARKLARTGIGRGAPGFQTNVRRIAVTPAIAARLHAGEQVSPEEISAAQAAMASEAAGAVPVEEKEKAEKKEPSRTVAEDNEWLPDELRRASKGDAKARKGKTRR
jgi:hypothetical protein